MQYKTIVLELLQQTPQIYDQLLENRTQSDPSQIASEALEIALSELEDRLTSASPPDDHQPLSLDAAMAFIRGHTPRG